MEALIVFGCVVVGAITVRAGVRALEAQARRRWLERWSRVREAGLTDIEIGRSFGVAIRGRLGPFRVRIERFRVGKEDTAVQVVVEGDAELSLRAETLGSRFEKTLGGVRETQIGDESFDGEVYVQGSDPVARAILDARTRALLLPLFAGRLRYEGNESPGLQVEVTVVSGELRVVFRPLFVETLHRQLRDVLGALRLVAESLRTPADVPGRIALNNQSEPEWKVRVANLRCLAETFANARATQEALRAAAQDERLEVQLAAARALPANEGRALLVDIASREWADDACAAEAVGALGDGFPAEKALATLTHALRSRRISTASGCLARLGNTRNERFVEPLGKVLAVEKGPLALAAARALGALGATSAEAPLLEALVRREPDLEVAVVEALGQAGSAGAVLTLKDLQERKDTDRQLRSAARQAVARIQSRLVGASPGQLSLASGEAGQLSLADEDPKGRLSLPEPPPAE